MSKRNRGFALILVLVISTVLLSLTAILGTSMVLEAKQASAQQKKTQAYYIARSGAVATAKWITTLSSSGLINFNLENFPITSTAQTFGAGKFTIKITQSVDKTQLIIVSTGRVANGSTAYATDTATIVLSKTTTTPSATTQINTVLYANTNIKITSAVNGNIGTSSISTKSIDFEWGGEKSNISNIYIPTGGKSENIINYPKYFSFNNKKSPIIVPTNIKQYPAPILPDFPTALSPKGDISLSGSQSMTINSSESYNNVSIVANTNLMVDTTNGDINIRVAKLNIPQGNIQILGSGNLNLYVDSFTNGTINGTINSTKDKSHFKLYYKNTIPFTIDGATNINGSVFFGTADFTINAGAIVSGDIFSSGSNVTISGGAAVGPEVIYAPNAFVNITNGTINSAIISNSVTVTGGATVNMPLTSVIVQIPGAVIPLSSTNYSIAYWK